MTERSLTPGEWQQVKELLADALELPLERRPAFLARACADSPVVRAELDSLLAAHTAAGAFLDELDASAALELLETMSPLADGDVVGRYRLVRPLGRGGMGVVYLAEDLRLQRTVALKFLAPHRAVTDAGRQRLLAEARAAAALDHPNIAVVHEVGEAGVGRMYIAMTCYEKATLRDRIAEGPLPVARAVALARGIAEGLAAAHARGVIHRDIKPSNIALAEDGTPKIVDFGIARASGTHSTTAPLTPGTIAYMSPEQTRGLPADPRSDLWSLGVVLYEMLAGRDPFEGVNLSARIQAIRHEQPRPLRRADVPRALGRVIGRCLEKEPAARYQTATELASALRAVEHAFTRERADRPSRMLARYLSAAALAVLALGGGFAALTRETGTDVELHADRIAVLPLVAVQPEDDDVADGLTEELIARLSKLSSLRVIARSSVMKYRGSTKGAAEIGGELAAGSLLEGSVRRQGAKLRIDVRLVDGRSEETLWSATYVVDAAQFSDVQRSIAEQAALALHVKVLDAEQQRLAADRTPHPAAYERYLQGRHFLNKQHAAAFERSEQLFTEALDIDPAFAAAWAGLAEVYSLQAWYWVLPPEDGYPRARAAAEKALVLDPDLPYAHATLAAIMGNYYWDWSAAEHHYRRAIELSPSFALVRQGYAEHLHRLGRVEEALEHAYRARELDPLAPAAERTIGDALYHAGRHDEAIAQYRRIVTLYPEFTSVFSHLGLPYLASGRPEEALAAWRQLLDMRPDDLNAALLVAYGEAVTGRLDRARATSARLEAQAADRYVSPFHRAALSAVLGDHDRAFALLEEAYVRRDVTLTYLRMDPVVFAGLRADPRFPALLQKMGMGGD